MQQILLPLAGNEGENKMSKTCIGILNIMALTLCFGLNTSCENEDTKDTSDTDTETATSTECPASHDMPQASQQGTQTVDLETLEEKIVPLQVTDPLGEGLKFSISYDSTESLVKTEVIDYHSPDGGTDSPTEYALKITAPEFPLMPNSDYITSTSIGIGVENRCGGIDLSYQFNMLYGCAPITLKVEKSGGMRYAKIIGSRYKQDTKVTINAGRKVHVFADGEICWSKFDSSTCQGANQWIGHTWGLWAKIGDDYYPLKNKHITTIEHSGKNGELSFIVPDGPRPYETLIAGDEQYCTDDVYKDSGGKGIDVNFYVE